MRWRRGFGVLLFVTAVTKCWLAWHLPLFVDEAFYWQESRHPAWSYSDLPALTAWLIRAGQTLFGSGTLGVRSIFIIMALLLPLMVQRIAARHFGATAGWQAACWSLLLPLLACFGVLALPDVPLTFFCLLAIAALDQLAERPRSLPLATLLGLALALGWLSHYRAAMLWLGIFVFLVATPRGRAMWKARGLWLAGVIGACGLLPALFGDAAMGGDALRFQFVDRHPWAFHADALLQPLEQALVTTPLLYGLLIATLLAGGLRWGRASSGEVKPPDLLICVAATFLVGYFVLGLFADAQRFRVHWPVPAYLLLIAMLPTACAGWIAARPSLVWVMRAAVAMAVVATVAVFGYLGAASISGGASFLSRYKAFPEHFVGWNEAAAMTREVLGKAGTNRSLLVADNFMLAAELDFALDGSRVVYSLDHPLNVKHGRASQLHTWQRDEAGLAARKGQQVVLVVDETAGRERERPAWLATLCGRILDLQPLTSLHLYEGRKRLRWYSGRVPDASSVDIGECSYPPSP